MLARCGLAGLAGMLIRLLSQDTDAFLKNVSGVIHVGASRGQEKIHYHELGVGVVWVEAIPEVFEKLQRNIAPYPEQRALNALVADTDGTRFDFHVSSNHGESSSIFHFHLHREIWPHVEYDRDISLESVTLATLLRQEHLDPTGYDALVLDTQGSELLVLKGAESLLGGFKFIKTEASDFEAYKGGCLLADIQSYLNARGFVECARKWRHMHKSGGCYFDVVYRNTAFDTGSRLNRQGRTTTGRTFF